MQKNVTLYNMIVPVWLLMLFPLAWPIVLLGNFAVDSLVLCLGMRRLALADKRAFYRRHIWKIWGCGFLGDLPGALLMLTAMLISDWVWVPEVGREGQSPVWNFLYENITGGVMANPFSNIWAFLWVTAAVAVSALCLYWLNRKLVYRRTELEEKQKKRLSLLMALVTAPWVFYLPTVWFYR